MDLKHPKNSFLQWALFYASLGLHVLPLKPRAKEPATRHGYKDATTDPDQIRAWWRENPEYNIGLRTGEISGLCVVDIDQKPPEGFPLPVTPQVRTGGRKGNGLHVYYRLSGPMKSFRFSIGDFLAEGKYVVAPPSIHPDGRRYEYVDFLSIDNCELMELPAYVLAYLERDKTDKADTGKSARKREGARKSTEKRKDILPCSLPRSPREDWPYREFAQDESVAMRIVELCGGEPQPLGVRFPCPFHKDEHASVALYKPPKPGSTIYLHHFHGGAPDHIPLCDLYAHCRFGRKLPLSPAERPAWWNRVLHDLGLISLPEISYPPLPDSAPQAAVTIFEGFILLLRCREAFEAGQLGDGAPYSWRFAADWCGIRSDSSIAIAMKYLRSNNFLIPKEREFSSGGKLNFYRLPEAVRS